MTEFVIRFLICNVFISIIIGILLLIKHVLKNHLTSRMHYNIWFLLLGLLAVPFIPVRPIRLPGNFGSVSASPTGTAVQENGRNTSGWFIGYIEKDNRTYFFATNIQSGEEASGSLAAELTFTVLSRLKLWNACPE